MAAVRYKELLGWYVITLRLRETVESRLPKKSTYVGEIVPDHKLRSPKSEWVISIEEKLAQGRQDNMPGLWAKLSIYRIPHYLKHGENKAWVPQIVSLGPYHHSEDHLHHLHHMERHKWRCLYHILKRSGQGIGLYLDSMKKVERRARACYEGRISKTRDEFAEMMVLDGCFVIEMFRGFAQGFKKLGYLPNDPIFSKQGLIVQIRRDMIMLENQIPLFILDRLLNLIGDPNQKECVVKLAIQFFSPMLEDSVFDNGKRLKFDPLYKPGKVHCLEVLQRSLLPLKPNPPKTKQWVEIKRSLTLCLSDLREAGIQIRSKYAHNWGDIRFKNGILWIPHIEINEEMRLLFLNLIAFEQSHFNCTHHVTSYVIFMHNLINSPDDVRCLCSHGIIKHHLGGDAEVANFFDQFCQEVVLDEKDSYLKDLSFEINWYCIRSWFDWRVILRLKWNAWGAILKNKYLDNPWSTISVIAAFILLVLTFTQTFYGVYGYYRPHY